MLDTTLRLLGNYTPAPEFSVYPPLAIVTARKAAPERGLPRARIHGSGLVPPLGVNIGGSTANVIAFDVGGEWIDVSIPRGKGVADMSISSGAQLFIAPSAIIYKKPHFNLMLRR